MDQLCWFGEKLAIKEGEVLYVVWAVHRQTRLVRYTLPLHEINKCSKLVLKVTDVD